MAKPFVINVVVDNQQFQSADPVRCHPGRRLIFMIHNEDVQSYDVTINPAEFFEKEDAGTGLPASNPTTANAPITVTVSGVGTPGSSKPIKFMLRPKAQFGKGAGLARYTTYKYTVRGNISGGAALVPLDPDFDVTFP